MEDGNFIRRRRNKVFHKFSLKKVICISLFIVSCFIIFSINEKIWNDEESWWATQLKRRELMKNECSRVKTPSIDSLIKSRNMLANIIVDDTHKLLYCYIPKIACTQWKRIMMVLAGKATDFQNPEAIPEMIVHYSSGLQFLSDPSIQEESIKLKLETYTKFLIVRHPLERLLSAYNNKFTGNSKDARNFQKLYALGMMKYSRSNSDNIPASGAGMTFQEFLFYLTNHDPQNFQEHWKPYVHLCHPCTIHYDVIGKFETIESDSNEVLRNVGAPPGLSFPKFKTSKTSEYLTYIKNNMTRELIDQVTEVFAYDYKIFGYEY